MRARQTVVQTRCLASHHEKDLVPAWISKQANAAFSSELGSCLTHLGLPSKYKPDRKACHGNSMSTFRPLCKWRKTKKKSFMIKWAHLATNNPSVIFSQSSSLWLGNQVKPNGAHQHQHRYHSGRVEEPFVLK